MKYALVFLAGVVIGAGVLHAWQNYSFNRHKNMAVLSGLSFDGTFQRESFKVTYGKPVRVEVAGSGEVFTVILSSLANGKVGYVWHSEDDKDLSGGGELFEKYKVVGRSREGIHVVDAGGSLGIELKGVVLDWSAGSRTDGYLYYNPDRITLANVDQD